MKLLVTGGAGFLGSNLAMSGMARGWDVIILDNFSKGGTEDNLKWLLSGGKVALERADIRSAGAVEGIVEKHKPDAIFHTAGQVAMTKSIEDPRLDFEVNALGTLNVLEAVRKHAPDCPVLFSSTNKVYGDLENFNYTENETRYEADGYKNGFDETLPLDFHSPYGCSKGAADQYLLDYHRIFGIKTVVFRHSSMYGARQFATFDQGWVGWFASQALAAKEGKVKEISISGNGKQVRDLLFASDMADLYFTSLEKIGACQGQAFNIGGGMANSMSVLELLSFFRGATGAKFEIKFNPPRSSDQKVFVANLGKIRSKTGWSPKVSKEDGLNKMLDWCQSIKQ